MWIPRRLEEEEDDDDNTLFLILIAVIAFLIALCLLSWCLFRTPKTRISNKNREADTEVLPRQGPPKTTAPIDMETPEIANTESSASTDDPITTCDVKRCGSASCPNCRRNIEPAFIPCSDASGKFKLKQLPARWWEKNFDEEALKTMASDPFQKKGSKSVSEYYSARVLEQENA